MVDIDEEIAAEQRILLGMKNLLNVLNGSSKKPDFESFRNLELQILASENKIAALTKQLSEKSFSKFGNCPFYI